MIEVIRVIILLSFSKNVKTFGYAFIVVNFLFGAWIIYNYSVNKQSYTKAYPLVLTFQLLESIFFCLIGVYCTKNEHYFNNSSFVSVMCYTMLIWIISTLVCVVGMIFFDEHLEFFNKSKFKKVI